MRPGLPGTLLRLAPLVIAVLVGVAAPLGLFLWRAVAEREVAVALPRTAVALRDWNGSGLPEDAAFEALANDLRNARWRDEASGGGRLARAGTRLEAEVPGLRAALPLTAQRIAETQIPPDAAVLLAAPIWERPEAWAAIRRTSDGISFSRLLAALDLRRAPEGQVVAVPAEIALHRAVTARSLGLAALVALAALAAGAPLAWVIAAAERRWATPLLGLVLLAALAGAGLRGASWWALLHRDGVLDDALMGLGLTGAPLDLLRTRWAVVLGALHGALPLAVLPMALALRRVDRPLLRMAAALGAPPWHRARRLVLPVVWPGLALGAALAFAGALGDAVVPALLGGPREAMLAGLVSQVAGRLGDPGLAAALSLLLLLPLAAAVLLGLRAARRLVPSA
ncbi:ABC transporter permease subunit [Muricoccus radiodurans]|uniref:ABC transporter permease subunit n=1 Tax=Muricoccus radiodurans TaxID=2231721 RepID=UPI003CF58CB7